MRIPMGQFGQVVAQPQQAVRVPADTAVADAMQQLGQTAAGIGTAELQADTRLAQHRKDIEERTAAARVRTTTINDLADLQEEISRGIVSGAVPKDQADATWQTRSTELLRDRTKELPPDFAGQLDAEFSGLARRGQNAVRDAVFKRDQHDANANLMTLGEQYQRMAVRDREKAQTEYFAQIDVLGPQAGMQPDAIQRLKQGFIEQTTYTEAFGLVRGARGSIKDVQAARAALATDRFAAMDPQKRAVLEAQLDGYETTMLQRQEIAAQRAERLAAAHLRKAGEAFDVAQRLVDSGVPLAADEYDRLATATVGTPYATALKALQQHAREVGGFGAQPIQLQRAALDQVNAAIAQQGASQALVKRRDQLEKVLAGSTADIKEDPLRAALQRGVISEIPPLDMSSIKAATASLAGRQQAAAVTAAWAGQAVSPLTREEAEQLGKMISMLPVDQRSTAIAGVAQTMGPQASAALGQQVAPKDKALGIALAMAGSKTTWGRLSSELVLRGSQALKDKAVQKDDKAAQGVRAQVAAEIGNAYTDDALREEMIEATVLIEYGRRSEGQGGIRGSVNLATGGITERNGRKVPLPYGVTADDFEKRLRAVRAADLVPQLSDGNVYVGGQPVDPNAFVAGLPQAVLVHAGQGRYVVEAGGSFATNVRRQPIVIEVR